MVKVKMVIAVLPCPRPRPWRPLGPLPFHLMGRRQCDGNEDTEGAEDHEKANYIIYICSYIYI